MANVLIDYKKIIEDISAQVSDLVMALKDSTDPMYDIELYDAIAGITINVEDEQAFIKATLNKNTVHIVVKFGSASVNFGSSICNVNLLVYGLPNKVDVIQRLLGAYVTRYNLQFLNNDEQITQILSSPTVLSNFNPTDSTFRNLYSVASTLIIGKSVIRVGQIQYKWGSGNDDLETIDFISYGESYNASTNPQPFGNTHGFASTEINFGTGTFSITTYLLNSRFVTDCMHARGLRKRNMLKSGYSSNKLMNDYFDIRIDFDNGYSNYNGITIAESITINNVIYSFAYEAETEKVGTTITTYYKWVNGNNAYYTTFTNPTTATTLYTKTSSGFAPATGVAISTVTANTDAVFNSTFFQRYKLVNYTTNQRIGEIPSFTVSFSY